VDEALFSPTSSDATAGTLTLMVVHSDDVSWIRVEWGSGPDEPVVLHSALNVERFEIRKLEEFRDGQVGFAERFARTTSTRLGLAPNPMSSRSTRTRSSVPKRSRGCSSNLLGRQR
jgi:hypothetical protein